MVAYSYTGSNVVFSRNRVAEQRRTRPAAHGGERHDRISQNSFSSQRRRRCDRAWPSTWIEHARSELARRAERRHAQRRERRGHRAERPAELSRHHLPRSSPTANCRSRASRGRAARSSCTVAQADPSGFGEGLTYLGDAHRRLLPATSTRPRARTARPRSTVVLQGTDTTNRFAFRDADAGRRDASARC